MLVLGRKEAEAIKIGDVEVVVLRIQGNRVKLGIVADKSIHVLRTELINYEGNDGCRDS